eukprot:1478723-Pyramimonas_sp.AAC.1
MARVSLEGALYVRCSSHERVQAHALVYSHNIPALTASDWSGCGRMQICAVTPAAKHGEETHNTLKFASRAKFVEVEVRAMRPPSRPPSIPLPQP